MSTLSVDARRCRRALEAEQRRELAEVVAGTSDGKCLARTVDQCSYEFDLAVLDDVDTIARMTLYEQHFSGTECHLLRRTCIRYGVRREFHDIVREWDHPFVVRRDDDDPSGGRERPEQSEQSIHLYVVEVRRRFVREDQWWIRARVLGRSRPAAAGRPDMSAGLWLNRSPGRPVRADRPRARRARSVRHAGASKRQHHVLERGQARNQIERLEDDTDGVATGIASSRGPGARPRWCRQRGCFRTSGSGWRRVADRSEDFPQPLAPSRSTSLPDATVRSNPSMGRIA